jgi:hypothetical protein
MRRVVASVALAAGLALQAAPAEACSFSWSRGQSPAEIRENPDLRRVSGTFRFIQGRGGNGEVATNARGWLYGRIDSERGRYWNTIQFPMYEIAIECGAYLPPTGNGATGTFWISRERTGGRYRLMLWEGRYVPSDPPAAPDR